MSEMGIATTFRFVRTRGLYIVVSEILAEIELGFG
jgi:hypothetical protein